MEVLGLCTDHVRTSPSRTSLLTSSRQVKLEAGQEFYVNCLIPSLDHQCIDLYVIDAIGGLHSRGLAEASEGSIARATLPEERQDGHTAGQTPQDQAKQMQ